MVSRKFRNKKRFEKKRFLWVRHLMFKRFDFIYPFISQHINFINSPRFRLFNHNNLLEFVWTLLPAVVVLFLLIPSFWLLTFIEGIQFDEFFTTIRVTGNQWFWTYDFLTNYSNPINTNFDSYMILEESLNLNAGELRLLETDNALLIPTQTPLRFLITSSDVLHSWAVPSLGIKVDACPGRLNQNLITIKRPGIFYGQCSEICGVNHGFMPINLVVID